MSRMAISINSQTFLLNEEAVKGVEVVRVFCDQTTPETCPTLDQNIIFLNRHGLELEAVNEYAEDRISTLLTGAPPSRH
jgi:hypothetical protein